MSARMSGSPQATPAGLRQEKLSGCGEVRFPNQLDFGKSQAGTLSSLASLWQALFGARVVPSGTQGYFELWYLSPFLEMIKILRYYLGLMALG